MAVSRWGDHVQSGTHAARPAASAVAVDALYACSDHYLVYQSDGASTWTTWLTADAPKNSVIAIVFDTPIVSDQIDVVVPFDCTIADVTMLADAAGSIVVDIWKDSYANYPPTDADSITASAPPTLSTAEKSVDSTLTGWTTSLTKGELLRFSVDSVTSVARLLLSLGVTR